MRDINRWVRMVVAIFIVALAYPITAFAAKGEFPESAKSEYVNRCSSSMNSQGLRLDKSRGYCRCIIDAQEIEFGKKEYGAMMKAQPKLNGNDIERRLYVVFKGCKKWVSGPVSTMRALQTVDIFMEFNWKKQPGKATVVWQKSKGSPLSEDDTRIVLATFLYARTLVNHDETRLELMRRMKIAASKLKVGSKNFEFGKWHLGTGGLQFTLFPWLDAEVGSLKKPKVYSVSLVKNPKGAVGGILNMSVGLERILAPSAPLILIQSLVKSLDNENRKLLGEILLGVNDFYSQEAVPFKIGSDNIVTQATMAHLRTRSANTHKSFKNKSDLMSGSRKLAKQFGQLFQASRNCKQPSRMDIPRAAGFFINYMPATDVQLVMDQYLKGRSEFNGQVCSRKKLVPMAAKLMGKTNSFILRAKDFRRP